MTNKIIAAAREAGFQISDQFGIQAGPMVVQSAAERFYAIAYRAGLERAAKVCETEWSNVAEKLYGQDCADQIRALMKENTHG